MFFVDTSFAISCFPEPYLETERPCSIRWALGHSIALAGPRSQRIRPKTVDRTGMGWYMNYEIEDRMRMV